MILQALTAYYEQLLRLGKLAAPGWDSNFKVSFALRINDSGQLLDLIDYRQMIPKGKKEVLSPAEIPVPAHVKRSSGVAANFLCDNSTYILGADDKGKPDRAIQCFEACAALHHKILDDVDVPAAKAVLNFFDGWNPAEAPNHPLLAERWKELTGNANLIFEYEAPDGNHERLTDDSAVKSAWQNYYSDSDPNATTVQCLVTGKEAPLALIHPSIKGVMGAQSSGAALVSFNAPSYCSYEHEQGANAPISEYAAFAYTTALNTLIADKDHCKILGDMTVVCWAENASASAASFGMAGMFGIPENSGVKDDDLSHALEQLSRGKEINWKGDTLLPRQHFYVLGLAPNAARISVRFFLRDTLGGFAEHLQQHFDALEIVKPSFDDRKVLSVWSLARETVNLKERTPSPSPQLAGDLLRAVLTGGRYPATLLNGVSIRIRAEHNVTRGRAAILKAYYLRNRQNNQTLIPEEVLTMELNENSNYMPYVLGRLFSVLEAIQNSANPNINTTIKDRYFNSACATPAMVFPTLINLAQKHLNKLSPALETTYNKQLTELFSKIDKNYPARMTLPEQGAFQIGYYHQTQKRFTKKNEEE